jgi:hypothetical protein
VVCGLHAGCIAIVGRLQQHACRKKTTEIVIVVFTLFSFFFYSWKLFHFRLDSAFTSLRHHASSSWPSCRNVVRLAYRRRFTRHHSTSQRWSFLHLRSVAAASDSSTDVAQERTVLRQRTATGTGKAQTIDNRRPAAETPSFGRIAVSSTENMAAVMTSYCGTWSGRPPQHHVRFSSTIEVLPPSALVVSAPQEFSSTACGGISLGGIAVPSRTFGPTGVRLVLPAESKV